MTYKRNLQRFDLNQSVDLANQTTLRDSSD